MAIELSARLRRIKTSPSLIARDRARRLQSEGRDILDLTAGEPDFDTPPHVADAVTAALTAGTLPVFAAGVIHRGPYKDGPGEINVPVAIDGMVIELGDLVIGDSDGVLCVPYGSARALLEAGRAKAAAEAEMIAQIEAGTYSSAWVDAALRKGGCTTEQD